MTDVQQDVSSKTQYKSRSDFYYPAVPSNAQYLLPRNPQQRNLAAQRYEEYPVPSNSFSNVGRSLTSGLENFSNYISNLVNVSLIIIVIKIIIFLSTKKMVVTFFCYRKYCIIFYSNNENL